MAKKESNSRHSHSQTSRDENKENTKCITSQADKSTASTKTAKVALSSIQIPHTPLEVDEMGLYKIKPRPKDVADIKPKFDTEFCQPILR